VEPSGQPFNGIFVAGHSLPVHKDVEPWVFSFNDDIYAGSHVIEFTEDC
jgi:hypothetical protein